MTMTDAAIAATRAAAAEEARLAEASVLRATALVREAGDLVALPGDEGWLGPARAVFDDACTAVRGAVDAEEHELRLLAAAIRGAV